MTRNMIFGSAIAAIAAVMVVSSLMSDDKGYSNDRGINVNVEIDIDDDSVVISSEDGRTVVHTKNGKQTCGEGESAITITREDGSQTRIAC